MRKRRTSGGMVPYQPGLGHHEGHYSAGEHVIIPEVMPSSPYAGGGSYGQHGGGGYAKPPYQSTSWHGRHRCIPLYSVDPSAPYAIFTALRAIASSIRRRGPFALAELAVAGYIVLAGSAFALNMVAGRPMRLTNVPIFDPTATGANIAWFVRPIVGTAADMSLDVQVEMFSSEEADVTRGAPLSRLGQSPYAVKWQTEAE